MVFIVRHTIVHHLKYHLKSWELSLLLLIISYSSLTNKKGQLQKKHRNIPSHELHTVLQNAQFPNHWKMNAVGTPTRSGLQSMPTLPVSKYRLSFCFNLAPESSMHVLGSSLTACELWFNIFGLN